MMRSMFSGVSGLRVHQTRMDVIGNNIANVNTVGYKSSSAQFAESFSQAMRGAGSPQGGLGGTNPQQIGLGVQISSLDVNHTKGSAQRTDKPLDLMIDGNGFFCVTNDPNFQNKYYTRAGNFTTDSLGYVVTPSGYKLLGTDGKPLRVDKSSTRTGTKTTEVEVVGNINKETVLPEDPTKHIAYTTSMKVFDSLGSAQNVNINFGQRLEYADNTGAKGFVRQINFENEYIPASTGTPANAQGQLGVMQRVDPTTANAGAQNSYYARFNEKGEFVSILSAITVDSANGGVVTAGTEAADLALNMQVPGTEPMRIQLYKPATGANPKISVFEKLTHYASESSALGKKINGNSSGFLDNFNVSATGELIGVFTNGERESLGQIMLASFDNNVGLQKIGSNMFVDTVNSGAPKFGQPGSGSFGKVAPGALEMSNVDLSGEFTNMITTQRGFQANSRVVTTSDEMLQELVNLKR